MNKRKLLRYAAFVLGVVVVVFIAITFYSTIQSSSLDKQIAAFEARRKIPDSENAAVIYEKLFNDANLTEIFEDSVFKQMTIPADYGNPWKRSDHPTEAEFIEKNKMLISMLLEASKFDKCYFPMPNERDQHYMDNIGAIRSIAHFVNFAANNDVGEGRLDAAIEKHQCMLKMAEHIRQQPLLVNYLVGIAVEALSLSKLKNIILESEITEQQLNSIKAFPIETKDTWNNQLPQFNQAETLWGEKQMEKFPFFVRLRIRFSGQFSSGIERVHEFHLRILTDRRANRILIGLRRYKNQNGQWPESLEQIKSFVDPNVLIDPQNNGFFVYKQTEDSFTLYSKGPNNIDEGGNRNEPADDWPIWPTTIKQKPESKTQDTE